MLFDEWILYPDNKIACYNQEVNKAPLHNGVRFVLLSLPLGARLFSDINF